MDPRTALFLVAYLLAVGLLAYLGYRDTRSASDYLVAGRNAHPVVMALSYGATFVGTGVIVGLGGMAGRVGMSLLWVAFLSIFAGVFVGFVLLGGRTCRMGRRLEAQTFPELLGRRYGSRFIQFFAGLVIFLFMPLYGAVVLVAGAELVAEHLPLSYGGALLLLSAFVGLCVVAGGLKGVMSAHALQGGIVLLGMALLVIAAYRQLGGVVAAHRALAELAPLVPQDMQALGHRGWTAMPEFGWGARRYDLWWTVVSTVALGLGIGMLGQPQLLLRFMTVESRKQLNRAVAFGGVFMLVAVGGAVIVGSLSNAYFISYGELLVGRVLSKLDPSGSLVVLHVVERGPAGTWVPLYDEQGRPRTTPARLGTAPSAPPASGLAEARGLGDLAGAFGPPRGAGGPPAAVTSAPFASAMGKTPDGEPIEVYQGRALALHYAGGEPERIIPTYVKLALPERFGPVLIVVLLAAAMSTLSSQFHVLGAGIGRDLYEQYTGSHRHSVRTTRLGVVIGVVMAGAIAWRWPGGVVLARAGAIFFGLCASAFLPAYVGGLFWRRMTRAGAIASMVTGFLAAGLWLLLVKAEEAGAIGLVQRITGGQESILAGHHNWPVVDPIVVALPLSVAVAVVVSLLTGPPDAKRVERCFGSGPAESD